VFEHVFDGQPVFWFHENAFYEVFDYWRKLSIVLVLLEGQIGYFLVGFVFVFACERCLSRQKLVSENSNSPRINFVVVRRVFYQLGRHIVSRTAESHSPFIDGVSGPPKVAQLNVELLVVVRLGYWFLLEDEVFLEHFRVGLNVLGPDGSSGLFGDVGLIKVLLVEDQDVFRFYVPVDNVAYVHVPEGRDNLANEILGLLLRKRALCLEVLVEVVEVCELENDVDAGFVVEVAVEAYDVGVPEPPLDLKLLLHLAEEIVLLQHVFLQLLDCHWLLRITLDGFEDRTELASAYLH